MPIATEPLDPRLRLKLLDRVQRERVDPRLRQGLREATRVDLILTEVPGAIQSKLRVYSELEGGTTVERPTGGSIKDIFEQAGGRLLILGEAGTGKTNMLLELASSLIEDAKRDETLPIPVVFNLPRWTLVKSDRTLAEWLKDDLGTEYGVYIAADVLVTCDRILPLLDGLDEVSEKRRAACVEAINEFQRSRDLGGLAVCCRTQAYETLQKLELGTAVRLEKLSRADVERELEKPRLEYVKRALEFDPQLWELIDTPLRLHVLYGAAQVAPPTSDKSAGQLEALYARYVEYAIHRHAEGSPRTRTAREPMLRYLGWLALEMRHHCQTQFAVENLRPNWVPAGSSLAPLAFGLVSVLALGVIGGLIVGLMGGRGVGLNGWLSVGLIGGLGVVLAGGLIGCLGFIGLSVVLAAPWLLIGLLLFPRSILNRWQVAGLALALVIIGLGFWLGGWPVLVGLVIVGLVVCVLVVWRSELISLVRPSALVVIFGLVIGLGMGLGAGLSVGLGGRVVSALVGGLIGGLMWPVSGRSRLNRIQGALRYALAIALLTIALAASGFGILRVYAHDPRLPPLLSLMVIQIGVLLAWAKGGSFVSSYYSVRFSLWRQRLAPLQYVRFLNEATERLFLIRHGESYEFFHVTFRNYMADAHGCLVATGDEAEVTFPKIAQ